MKEREIIQGVIQACERIGESMCSRTASSVSDKEGHSNFVTDMDVWVQTQMIDALRALVPDAHFIAEEAEKNDAAGTGYCFVLDPIDGTLNFLCDMEHSAISVGLLRDGEIVGGVVRNPYRKETFWAIRGEGAWCNGERIHVSTRDIRHSVALVGTSPYRADLCDHSFATARLLMREFADVRRFGCASLDLCNVACGRCDAYFELVLQPWDFAAGAIIVREAGGTVEAIAPDTLAFDRPSGILAAAPHALEPMRRAIEEARG